MNYTSPALCPAGRTLFGGSRLAQGLHSHQNSVILKLVLDLPKNGCPAPLKIVMDRGILQESGEIPRRRRDTLRRPYGGGGLQEDGVLEKSGSPLQGCWVPKGQRGKPRISQAKGQDYFVVTRYILIAGKPVFCGELCLLAYAPRFVPANCTKREKCTWKN